jgi:hypothetical protein
MGDARIVSAETEIRQALSTKGKRYGERAAHRVARIQHLGLGQNTAAPADDIIEKNIGNAAPERAFAAPLDDRFHETTQLHLGLSIGRVGHPI